MQVQVQSAERFSIEQIREFLAGSQGIEFQPESRAGIYAFTEQVLVDQEYLSQGKRQRGWIRAFLGKTTGLSSAQLTRLIRQYAGSGQVREAPAGVRRRFPCKYSVEDPW